MRTISIGVALPISGLGMAVFGGADADPGRSGQDYPPGCIVGVAVAPGFLPRAGLTVENRLARPIRVRLEGRAGSDLADAELGTIGSQEQRIFTHALPAGRNALIAEEEGSGRTRRQVLFVSNRGADTCNRRSLARIE